MIIRTCGKLANEILGMPIFLFVLVLQQRYNNFYSCLFFSSGIIIFICSFQSHCSVVVNSSTVSCQCNYLDTVIFRINVTLTFRREFELLLFFESRFYYLVFIPFWHWDAYLY